MTEQDKAEQTKPLNPECQQGKHGNCDDRAIDDADQIVGCHCHCHTDKVAVPTHAYLSTACHHGNHRDCRLICKFCAQPCTCPCHPAKLAVR